MFDTDTRAAPAPPPGPLPGLDAFTPAGLVEAISGTYRLESALTGQRMCAVAALLRTHRSTESADPQRAYATLDAVDQTAAQVAAALNISAMSASYQVHYAEALDVRLPRIRDLLLAGQIDWRVVQLVISRTDLVTDHELLATLDERIAAKIGRWGGWSRQRVINAVDKQVLAIDADAAHQRRRDADAQREIGITAGSNGMAELWGTVGVTDAVAFDRALTHLANSVCRNDPRPMAHRRADALGALATGTTLACRCRSPHCPARTAQSHPEHGAAKITINVLARASTLAGDDDAPAYIEGYGVIDAEQLRQLAATASRRLLDELPAGIDALSYRPSAALERAIRCRDLTCRFPGCDRPAEFCDIDHTIPFNHTNPAAGGLTVPTNLKTLCRLHHRLKTFFGGPTGWRDVQLPDGTVIWTSPTGQTYRTTPAGTELFNDEPARRPRPRAQQRATRIARARTRNRVQRAINDTERALRDARKDEIQARKFRNHMRAMLFVFKGTPSTSPYCSWINDPHEPEELPPNWQPPPPPPPSPDDPPF